jgi:uncharacterized protein (DUF302 family)
MDHQTSNEIGISVKLNATLEIALARVIEALKVEGFGVLTEIDVKETFQKKLNVSFPPYKILGACNAVLAHRALAIDPQVGLLLPCNVTVRQLEDETSEVSLVDPLVMLGVITHPGLKEVAEEARIRLERVAFALNNSQ